MTRKKIIGFGVAVALALLVVPVTASAAPEPAAPVFTEPRLTNNCYNTDDLDAVPGDDPADPDTTDVNLEAKGTNDLSATSVELYEIPPAPDPAVLIGIDVTVGTGFWEVPLMPAQFADGYHLLHAFAVNGLDVMRSLAGARVYCVDTIAPPAPTFSPIDAAPGDFAIGCVTNPFVMSGTSEPNSTVFVEQQPPGAINGSSLWHTRADSTGAWSINAHHDDLAGNHTVTVLVFARDGGRNQGPSVGASFDVCDDVTPPPAPTITQPSSGGLPSPAVMTIAGTATPDPCGTLRVIVREHSAFPDFFADFEATVDQLTGNWTLVQTFSSSGIVFLRAFALDCAGNMSEFSATVVKMVDVNAPEARITLPSGFLLADIWLLSSPQTFEGTAKDNYGLDHIEVRYVPVLLGAAAFTASAACSACPTDFDDVADPSDSFEPPTATWSDSVTLAPGLYRVEVVAVDLAGNRSRPDTMLVLVVDLP